ncbi:hypothetical protein TNCV_4931691, partial [Trichonephila clavipes]
MIVVQRVFRLHFDIPPRCRVPDRKCVLMWMDVSKGRKGPPKTIITHENVGRVRVTIQTGMKYCEIFFLQEVDALRDAISPAILCSIVSEGNLEKLEIMRQFVSNGF